MPTYHLQINLDRWRSLVIVPVKGLASYLAERLGGRSIAYTQIRREGGLPAQKLADLDLLGWPGFEDQRKAFADQIPQLTEDYQAHKGRVEGFGNFLIYSMPLPIRDRLNLTARQLGRTASNLAVELIDRGLAQYQQGDPMTEDEFKREMFRARALQTEDPDYWHGYQRGLRRGYHGEDFGTEQEHQKWLSLADETFDQHRKRRGQGYRDGLEFSIKGDQDD